MTAPSTGPVANAEPGRTPIQRAALVVGVVLLALGVLAFVPGVTTHYDRLDFVQHDARLFGVFWTSGLDNIVNLAFGVIGILVARSAFGSAVFLGVGGVFYVLIWLYSVLADPSRGNDRPDLGIADWVLHVVIGVGMVVVAVLARPRRGGRTPKLNDPPFETTPTPN